MMRSFQGLETYFLVELVHLLELGLLDRIFQMSSSKSHKNVEQASKPIFAMTRYDAHYTHRVIPSNCLFHSFKGV